MSKSAIIKSSPFGFLDILRVLGGILMVICMASYWFTGTTTWGYEGKWINPNYLRFRVSNAYVNLTLDQLAQYDGTIAGNPIYIAINGSVFDVSSSAHIYGPQGSYKMFSGRDCARAFCTGCFNKPDELTYDLRGLEDVECDVEINKWLKFFENHGKYWYVGTVSHDPIIGDPPTPCTHIKYPGNR